MGIQYRSVHGVAQDEIHELVKLQTQNEIIKKEIQDVSGKSRQLRKKIARGRGFTKEDICKIVGIDPDNLVAKPPPELTSLRKQLRSKLNDVKKLRSRWWADHREYEAIVKSMRQQKRTTTTTSALDDSSAVSSETASDVVRFSRRPSLDDPAPGLPSWLRSLMMTVGRDKDDAGNLSPFTRNSSRSATPGLGSAFFRIQSIAEQGHETSRGKSETPTSLAYPMVKFAPTVKHKEPRSTFAHARSLLSRSLTMGSVEGSHMKPFRSMSMESPKHGRMKSLSSLLRSKTQPLDVADNAPGNLVED